MNNAYLLERAARLWSDRTAVIDGNRSYTFAEVNDRAKRLASALSKKGYRKGDRIALLLGNQVEWFDTTFGLLRAGLIRTYLNPRHSTKEISLQIADAQATALIIGRDHLHRLDEIELHSVQEVIIVDETYEALLADADSDAPLVPVPADYPAEIRYTSGTTGTPKGAVQTHGAWSSYANAFAFHMGLKPDDILLHVGPMTHASGAMAYPLLAAGSQQVIHQGFDPVELVEAIPKYGITTVLLVPTMIYMLLEYIRERKIDASSLRTILYATAPMAPSRLETGIEMLGPIFQQTYALTEFLGPVTILEKDEHHAGDARLASTGRPAIGCEVIIADEEGKELPRGEIGELLVRGERSVKEYWNRPAETEKVFSPDGYVRTNDVAYMDEHGYVYIVDRKSELIISGGFNVYPAEVENALMSHSAVLEVAVFAIPDDKWGEAVHALVRVRDGHSADDAELQAYTRTQIAGYKVPKSISFTTDELPKGPTGKLLRRVARAPFWENTDRAVN